MPTPALTAKTAQPTPKSVSAVLGTTAPLWDEFTAHLRNEYGPLAEEWKFGKTGWLLVTKRKKRTVCYLFPEDGQFTVAFVFGEKAVAAARASKLPPAILQSIEAARPYAEGRGFYVVCKTAAAVRHLQTLTAIKLES